MKPVVFDTYDIDMGDAGGTTICVSGGDNDAARKLRDRIVELLAKERMCPPGQHVPYTDSDGCSVCRCSGKEIAVAQGSAMRFAESDKPS